MILLLEYPSQMSNVQAAVVCAARFFKLAALAKYGPCLSSDSKVTKGFSCLA
jgi:hypothetical protein